MLWSFTRTEAQPFAITSTSLSNGAVQMQFPSRADSYYLLNSTPSLITNPSPVAAQLGNGTSQAFENPINQESMFFRVEQLPLTSTNDILGDGIADGFKLQNGLPVFGPSYATKVPLGDTRTWLQIYRTETNVAALPLAYFPVLTNTVLVGSSNVIVPVAFNKPYTGRLTYQLSGSAVPKSTGVSGDYVPPAGSVFFNNAINGNITISLVPEPDIEMDRSIVIALSAPVVTNQTYTITSNSCVATVNIVQSSLGLFVGDLTFTNGLFAGSQAVKMALRPGGSGTVALLDVTGNALFSNTFSVPVVASAGGFQLNGSGSSSLVTNTPWGRNLSVSLLFGQTETNGTTFTTPVTMALAGLTASGVSYSGSGTLNVTLSQ